MLVLSRFRNERIIIGRGKQRIVVLVIDIRGDKVRLGVEAPRSVPVHREEIARRIEEEWDLGGEG